MKVKSAYIFVLLVHVCHSAITRTKFACENSKLELFCKKDEVVTILSANYGRETKSVCKSDRIYDEACHSMYAVLIVKDLCSGKQKCTIEANNNVFTDPCVGTHKYLEVKYTCAPDKTCLFMCDDKKCVNDKIKCKQEININNNTRIMCENKNINLTCDPGLYVYVRSANYGRTSSDYCRNGNKDNTNCRTEKAFKIMRNRCNGRPSCIVKGENALFGDPCPGVYKYLEVNYDCVPSFVTTFACEEKDLTIQCENDEVINIIDGNYGRTNQNLCLPVLKEARNCKSEKTTDILLERCNQQNSCSIIANNAVFGDPCEGTRKYLTVDYYCSAPAANDEVNDDTSEVSQ